MLRFSLFLLVLSGVLVSPQASAQPDAFDLDFAIGGVFTFSTTPTSEDFTLDKVAKVFEEPDGGYLVAATLDGAPGFLRLDAGGELDPAYGQGGIVRFDGTSMSWVKDAARLPDGRIVVVGDQQGRTPALLHVFSAEGTLDASVGNRGTIELTAYDNEAPRVLVRRDGTVILAGHEDAPGTDNDAFLVQRFRLDGTLDSDFGTDGETRVNDGGYVEALLEMTDGRLLVVGRAARDGSLYPGGAVARLTSEGQIDEGFGTGGLVLFRTIQSETGRCDRAMAAVEDMDRLTVVCVGRAWDIGPLSEYAKEAAMVVRLQSDGTFDEAFGDAGIAGYPSFGPVRFSGEAAAVRPSGEVIVVGPAEHENVRPMTVLQVRPDGVLDPAFGDEGHREVMLPNMRHVVTGLDLDTSGHVLVYGQYGSDGVYLAKLKPTMAVPASAGQAGSPDPQFGTGGARAHPELGPYFLGASQLRGDEDGFWMLRSNFSPGGSGKMLTRFRQDGQLDRTFGDEGTRVLADQPAWTDFYEDQRVLGMRRIPGQQVSQYEFRRYLTDGTLDPSFSREAVLERGSPIDVKTAPDGSAWILAYAGSTEVLLYRLRSDGFWDSAFGTDGVVSFQRSGDNYLGLVAHPEGGVVLYGEFEERAVVHRITDDGASDPAFGTAGRLVFDIPTSEREAIRQSAGDLAVDETGGLIVLGRTAVILFSGGGPTTAGIARVLPDGTLDPSFGDLPGGGIELAYWRESNPVSLALDSEGRILYLLQSTYSLFPGRISAAVVGRLTSDGRQDRSFGREGTGYVVERFGQQSLYPDGMWVDDNDGVTVTAQGFDSREVEPAKMLVMAALSGEPLPVDTASDIPTVSRLGELKLYPNPSQGQVWVQSRGLGLETAATIEVFDVTGRLVRRSTVEGRALEGPHRLELGTLVPGFYVVRVRSEENAHLGSIQIVR